MLMLSCNALCKHVNILMKKMQTPNFFVAIFKEKTIKNTKLQTLLKFRIFKHSTNLILSFNKLQTLMYFYNKKRAVPQIDCYLCNCPSFSLTAIPHTFILSAYPFPYNTLHHLASRYPLWNVRREESTFLFLSALE